MELDACDCSELRVGGLVVELAGHGIYSVNIRAFGGFIITEHLKIVLKHIDDLIGLELALNSRSHSIDESIKSFSKLCIILQSFCRLPDEILSVICTARIHTSVIICLCLEVDHAIGGL